MTSEEATAFEEDAGDKYADLNKQFLEYDPDSSEMDRDNEASEEDMKLHSELLTGSYYASFFLLAPLPKNALKAYAKNFHANCGSLLHQLGINPLSTSISDGLNREYSDEDIKALSVAELDDLMKAYKISFPNGTKDKKKSAKQQLLISHRKDNLTFELPIDLTIETRVNQACLKSWFMTSSDNDNTEWKSSMLAGSLTESKSLKSLPIFLKQKVQGVDIILLEELGLVQIRHFNDIVLKLYLEMLEEVTVRCLQWIKQSTSEIPPSIPEDDENYGGCVDNETLTTHY
eukprot:Em0008g313a